jgi:tRNA uridine 5-carboxymethylaminomethyl modification enzyme
VWALRAQTDKLEYAAEMRRVLEATENLFIREAMVTGLDIGPNDEVRGVNTYFGMNFGAKVGGLGVDAQAGSFVSMQGGD